MHKVEKSVFPYDWTLEDGYPSRGIEYHGKKVFGTFVCGGGSTMGYKLAGYNHIGGVEFDSVYASIYANNHKPKLLYIEDIRLFVERLDLPEELFGLDLLDGSPPCSAFSISGKRESSWGKPEIYRGVSQRKDDLPFFYTRLAEKLQPKVVVMENVSGMLAPNSQAYIVETIRSLPSYNTQVFSLNAASMGVPQSRQRLFVIGLNKRYNMENLRLNFSCKPIPFSCTSEFWDIPPDQTTDISKYAIGALWDEIRTTGSHKKRFNLVKPDPNKPCNTIVEMCAVISAASVVHPIYKRKLNKHELMRICTFPTDYKFGTDSHYASVMGRSVPPVMMAQLSHQIYSQWLSKI